MSPILFDFFVDSHFLQVRVVLLQLLTFGSVLLVLGGDVTAHARNAARLLLGAFEDNLHAFIFIFLCHNYFVFYR